MRKCLVCECCATENPTDGHLGGVHHAEEYITRRSTSRGGVHHATDRDVLPRDARRLDFP